MRKQWENPTVHHVWQEQDIQERLSTQPRFKPTRFMDKVLSYGIRGLYTGFNWITGYKGTNPTPESVAFRLILLESVAGVPGFVAASHRHFRSLRIMQRDNGWIHTLLEEAENERMHLLTFLQMFPPSRLTRGIVYATQYVFGAGFIVMYVLSPRMAHRFVGYFEETAVVTYSQVIAKVEEEGSLLNTAWSHLEAPPIAKSYWRLPQDATFLDTLKQIAVDETMHRDVNHTFADMATTDPNPFVEAHLDDIAAWQRSEHLVEGTELRSMSFDPADEASRKQVG
jgi:hypothetical protein